LPCSVGFTCPDVGLTRPLLCSNGQVCDTVGLRTSLKSCPSGFYCLNGTKASSTSLFKNANKLYKDGPAWITNELTDVVYFNASAIDYSFKSWPFPAFGQSRSIHPPADRCDSLDCPPGSSSVIAEAPYPCPLGISVLVQNCVSTTLPYVSM